MNARLPVLIIFSCLYFIPGPGFPPGFPNENFSINSPILFAGNREATSPGGDSKESSLSEIENYEKEKLAKLNKNVGKRYLTVKKTDGAKFYVSPDDLEKELTIEREKEGFVITELVRNRLGTMNFYQVKFDTGQIGYLSADGSYLDLKVTEGSLIFVPKKPAAVKKNPSQANAFSSQAIGLVKNYLISNGSAENQLTEEKVNYFPRTKYKYEAYEISGKKYRVLQYIEGGNTPPYVKKWIVDLSTKEVRPENPAVK